MINRRSFLKSSGIVIGTSLIPNIDLSATLSAQPNVEIELLTHLDKQPILKGKATRVFKYSGRLLKGPAAALTQSNSYLGPMIRVKVGDRGRIHLKNSLNEKTITHWHGLYVPENADGHPHYAIGPGGSYTYNFVVKNRPGTYWYHPHPHGRTGAQVYMGLAGLFIIEPKSGPESFLPEGEQDLAFVIQDRRFDKNNQFDYLSNGRHDRMRGMMGGEILINGQSNYTTSVRTGTYRIRILNGSNARVYKLGWSNQMPMKIIATDGGLLSKPFDEPYVLLAPAERIEVLVPFQSLNLNHIQLLNLPFDPRGKTQKLIDFEITNQPGLSYVPPYFLNNETIYETNILKSDILTAPVKKFELYAVRG